MGSFDGAEVCELVGMYLQNEIINSKIGVTKAKSGLYRDDGLILIKASKRELDNIRKKLEALLATHNLKITAETGSRITDYLYVTLNLTENTYKPYRKDDQLPVYIHKKSNHPPMIKKNLPTMIERRISDRCSNKELFEKQR